MKVEALAMGSRPRVRRHEPEERIRQKRWSADDSLLLIGVPNVGVGNYVHGLAEVCAGDAISARVHGLKIRQDLALSRVQAVVPPRCLVESRTAGLPHRNLLFRKAVMCMSTVLPSNGDCLELDANASWSSTSNTFEACGNNTSMRLGGSVRHI